MNKLIKAELYRLLHSTKLFWITVLGVFGTLFIGLENLPGEMKYHIELDAVLATDTGLILAGAIVAIIIFSVNCCPTFSKRLIYYEVMDGNSPLRIINSRLLLYGSVFMLIYAVPVALFFVIIGCSNGAGNADLVPYLTILFLFILKIAVMGILTAILFRDYWGPGVILCVCELVFTLFAFLSELSEPSSRVVTILKLTTIGQLFEFSGYGDALQGSSLHSLSDVEGFIPKFIVCFIVEIAILYFLAYRKLKNRRYK